MLVTGSLLTLCHRDIYVAGAATTPHSGYVCMYVCMYVCQHCGPCLLCSGIVFGLYQMTHFWRLSRRTYYGNFYIEFFLLIIVCIDGDFHSQQIA